MTSFRRWNEDVSNNWHSHAECRSDDPDVWRLFEPRGEKEPVAWQYGRAEIAIEDFCVNCPVMTQCAEERDRHEYQGVWGGELSEKRGIVSVETGMLLRKFPSQIAKEAGRQDESGIEDSADDDLVATS